MEKFEVEIKDILSRVVEVEATNEDEAIEKAVEMFKDGDIKLEASDFGPDFEIV